MRRRPATEEGKMEVSVKNNEGNRCLCIWPPLKKENTAIYRRQSNSRKKSRLEVLPLIDAQLRSIPGKIFLSNTEAAKDCELLTALDVTAVINVGGGRHTTQVADYLHFDIDDHLDVSYYAFFIMAADFSRPILSSGRNLLVHCKSGMHHSPAVAAAIIIRYAGLSVSQTIRCIQCTRPAANFSLNVERQLEFYSLTQTKYAVHSSNSDDD